VLEKLYSNKSEKDLQYLLKIYTALLIVTIGLLIYFLSYFFLSGNIHFMPSIAGIIVLFWSAYNVNYLKK
jgi:hypothetical protein